MAPGWYRSNQYTATSACEHCLGIIRHEPWCVTQNKAVLYAYEVIMFPDKLTEEDKIILHALGVTWATGPRLCAGKD